jgi:transposase
MEKVKIKVIKARLPKTCVCPHCGQKQRFKLNRRYYKYVKDMNLNTPVLLKVEMISAKCLNPACLKRCFNLPISGVERYQRVTQRLVKESINGIIQDNSTCPRISHRLNRTFNTTGSIATIDRWKHKEADKLDIKEIISKLNFSGILCVDEYKPKRYKGYDLIDSDGLTGRILYLEKAEGLGRGIVKEHFEKLKSLGINPYAIIFDMRSCFAGTAKKVFGKDILIQHDYFHVMKIVHYHLNRAMAEYRHKLKEEGIDTLDIWQARWVILKNIEDWTFKEHIIIENLLSRYKGTIIEDILILKQKIRDIFLESKSQKEAILRRNDLLEESWHLKTKHFANIIKFLSSPYFKYMTTYLDYPQIPKSGNSENVIRTWRQMEKVRYGFKTEKGRLNHLKL